VFISFISARVRRSKSRGGVFSGYSIELYECIGKIIKNVPAELLRPDLEFEYLDRDDESEQDD
jgi:hypothetical protein